jgi:putative peptide zinc metalloprotease protein
MKSLLSTALVMAIVVAGLVVTPEATRAQSSGDGQPAPGAPAPAPSPAPEPGTSPGEEAGAPPAPASGPSVDPAAGAQAAPTPAAQEDAVPEDPVADEVVVRSERDDDQRGRGDHGPPNFWSWFGRNVVFVLNRQDGDLRVRGRVRLVHIKGDRAEPVNAAFAYSSCTDCQSYAVALEIALISPNASVIAPQNRARAINYECTRCVTFARALQYVYAVDDPDQVPDNVGRLVREMERELRDISRDRRITPTEANERVTAVIVQFQDLNTVLRDELVGTEDVTTPGASPLDPSAVPAPSPPAQ